MTTMAAELLSVAAQRDLPQLDEKLYLERPGWIQQLGIDRSIPWPGIGIKLLGIANSKRMDFRQAEARRN